MYQGRATGVSGLNAVVSWPNEEWGMRPGRLRRDASRLLRHPRARPRHGCQRDPGVDVLSDVRRIQRRTPSNARQDETHGRDDPAYNDWHIDDWAGAYPGRFIPLAIVPSWDPTTMVDEIRRVAAKGCQAVTHARAAPRRGPAQLPRPRLLGAGVPDALTDNGLVMCLHIGQRLRRLAARTRRPDRQPHHPRLPDLRARRPGPARGVRRCGRTRN